MIVIHEAGGLNDHIRDVAGRIAQLGYVTLAVDLYTREGGPPPMDDVQAMMSRLFSIPDQRVVEDLTGAAEFLRAREDASGKVGCIGFCMGGRYTLLFACSTGSLDAAVDCWGGLSTARRPRRSRPTRGPSLRSIWQGGCRVRFWRRWARRTSTPPPRSASSSASAQSESGHPVQVDIYDGAGHAFFADYRPTYRPEPAARLWHRIVPFLASNLDDG